MNGTIATKVICQVKKMAHIITSNINEIESPRNKE